MSTLTVSDDAAAAAAASSTTTRNTNSKDTAHAGYESPVKLNVNAACQGIGVPASNRLILGVAA